MTEATSPWSGVGLDFLSEGDWAIGQGPDAPDRQLMRALLARYLRDWRGVVMVRPRFLEVGFGSGIDVAALAAEDLLSEIDYLGYDLTPEFVEAAQERFPGQTFVVKDVLDMDERESEDFVWCRHVLEHVDDGYRALENLWNATRDVLLVSWFIRPTWNEGDVRCDISGDGFVHQHYSARRMIEFLGDLGAHRYRFDIDHHATKASLWLLTREKEPDLCEEAHRFLVSPRFLRTVYSVPPPASKREAELVEVLAEATEALDESVLREEPDTESGARIAAAIERSRAATYAVEPLRRHRRLVFWGFTESMDSMRHIFRHFDKAAVALGKETLRLPDTEESLEVLRRGDLVFAVDVEGTHLATIPGVNYVLHNFDGTHPIWERMEDHQFLRLQVYTNDAERYGVPWDPVRRFDAEARTLFQPWGTDLLVEEFMEPVWNPESDEAWFVGAIWDDGGLGNVETIDELRDVLQAAGLQFGHLTQISDEEMVAAVRGSRIAPAFAGKWQVENGYLPCRVFKGVSYGHPALTNVPKFREFFAGCSIGDGTLLGTVHEALALSERDWREYVIAQQQVVARYTYREGLQAIGRAIEIGK